MSGTEAEPRTIRTAVVGFGLSGSVFHAPLLDADNRYSLDVVATSNADRQEAAKGRYPGVKTVRDGEAVLELSDALDLVVLGTPPATHYPLAKAALEAGLDVVVDKPFAISSEEGQELTGLARKLGRVLTVFHNRRWDGDFLTLRKLLAAEAVGEVTRFESRFERWSPNIAKAWKARATAAEGGGALFDLGSHLIDQALQLFGPADVAHAELQARRSDERADDDVFLVLRHHSGVASHLSMNMLCAQQAPRFRVLGSVGGFTKHGVDPQEPYIVAGGSPLDQEYGVEAPEWAGLLGRDGHLDRLPTERGNYPGFYRLLADKILDGGAESSLPLPVDPEDAVEVLKIIEKARELA
ncbi:oxidoreductase domain protein [Pseudarthrobacter chlorophenolicus A6]|uniref:Oxidoreductase domain protein n=1 Tax=Pseudarthrobacter chlorophenolicus (strain ATCC 700700 / DSM 12829 / CIP 107037 / JCM 12360 / KCTC 9906 / NCIMB 13794 / A6) TaxID=452863 RepID=B8H7V4_PSECP|nr:Gfo/Idh/MocA family oxidoreductase [Pseudarthrobacter chlorophenolicus]ACL41757.1 oxidoreductase domain protein [Pseudarthrobacter chlorophenolicus A6]SDQ58930.1 Predicted dehydrogenase [Pseudarthrobacter chlorophenolicus]